MDLSSSPIRTRSGSQSSSLLSEIKTIFKVLEDKIDTLITRVEGVEFRLQQVQANQVTIDLQMKQMKEIIITQQQYIEKQEITNRNSNLIFTNIPESSVSYEGNEIESELEKLNVICKSISPEFNDTDIVSIFRLGMSSNRSRPRPLKVIFRDSVSRNRIFYNQRSIRNNVVKTFFSQVFVNKDLPPLTRKEESRLRDVARTLRSSSSADDNIYVKRGKLFKNHEIIDQIDIGKQLF